MLRPKLAQGGVSHAPRLLSLLPCCADFLGGVVLVDRGGLSVQEVSRVHKFNVLFRLLPLANFSTLLAIFIIASRQISLLFSTY